jgi:hypothetical protein
VSTLRVAPFNLYWGDSVYAKVVAINVYGDSLESETANGAIIITYPDAPLFLEEDINYRDWTTLGLKWKEGLENGGNQITSYVLSMAIEDAQFLEIQTNLPVDFGQTTVTDLTIGVTYKFKVQAVNDFGYSDYSNEVTLICSHIPEAPNAPTTTVVAN